MAIHGSASRSFMSPKQRASLRSVKRAAWPHHATLSVATSCNAQHATCTVQRAPCTTHHATFILRAECITVQSSERRIRLQLPERASALTRSGWDVNPTTVHRSMTRVQATGTRSPGADAAAVPAQMWKFQFQRARRYPPAVVLPRGVKAEDAAEAEPLQKLERPYVEREQHYAQPRLGLPRRRTLTHACATTTSIDGKRECARVRTTTARLHPHANTAR